MGKQFNIRSELAHELAVEWSARTGKSLAEVVEDALRRYDPPESDEDFKEKLLWGPLLRAAQRAARESPSDFKIEDLYDPETGLPA